MHNPIRVAAWGATLLFPSLCIALELPTLPLQTQWQQVEQASFDMKLARNNLRLAADEVDINYWQESKIVLSGEATQYLDDDDDDEDDDSNIATLDISLPLTSQLDVGTKLSTDDSVRLFTSYQPFAQNDITPEILESYQLALLTLQYTQTSLRDDLEKGYLDVVVAEKEQQIAELELAIAKQSEASIRGAFDLGEASSTDLIDAQKESIDAREELYAGMVTLAEAKQVYQTLLGDSVDVELSSLNVDDLSTLISERQEVITQLDDTKAQSEALSRLKVEFSSLKSQLDNIYDYDPGLELTLAYNVDDESVMAGFSIDLSPNQFGGDDQTDTATLISLKQLEIRDEAYNLTVELDVSRKKIDIAHSALESNRQALDQQQIYTQEAQFLLQRGKMTQVETAQQQLALTLAEQVVFVSLVDLYESQSELASLF